MNRAQGEDLLRFLVAMRAAYAYRGSYDQRSSLTVDEAVAYGERLLHGAVHAEADVRSRVWQPERRAR